MAPRRTPLSRPAKFTFDGTPLEGETGEPIAQALIAAEMLTIARSPKFHRPRGAACFRAACDGCLARVDGVPNVMTCLHPLADGAVVESQNTLGSRDIDLLRVTDWFFPDGLNHHEIFAGVPGVQSIMQAFARRVAGLGKLPTGEVPRSHEANRRDVDCLVIGAGPAGMITTNVLVSKDRTVEVIDDSLAPGGGARAVGVRDRFQSVADDFEKACGTRATYRPRTLAAGIFGTDVLVVSNDRTELLTPKTLVLATGAHDGVLAFEGNDLPGIISARAAGWLLANGVFPWKKALIAIDHDGAIFGEACFAALGETRATLVRGTPIRAKGGSRVKGVVVRDATGKETSYACDVLVIDSARSPAYELAIQAGAETDHTPAGYVVKTTNGKIRDGLWAVGEVAGTPLDLERMIAEISRAFESLNRP